MAVEALLPLDFAMDLCILASVQRALGRFSLRRLLWAQLALAAFTIAALFLPLPKGLLHIAACPLAASILLGPRSPRTLLEGAAGIFCGYAAAAGFAALAGRRMLWILVGMLAFALLLRRRRHIRFRWNIEVYLEKNGASACFPALIDTGNRLRDHGSGLPVLIAEEGVLGSIVDEIDPDDYIPLPYGVLGSAGEILCFAADALYMRAGSGFVSAPECRVAVYPGRIPGRIRALAPPEFAECTELQPNIANAVQNTLRRFHYVVFKHKTIHLRPGCSDSPGCGMLHRRQ